MALMKRKLPSKLTQEDPFATAEDAFAIPEPNGNGKKDETAEKTEQPVDVFADEAQEAAAPKEPTPPPMPPSQPEPEITEEPDMPEPAPEPAPVTAAPVEEPVMQAEEPDFEAEEEEQTEEATATAEQVATTHDSNLKRQVKRRRNRKGGKGLAPSAEEKGTQAAAQSEEEAEGLMVEAAPAVPQEEVANKVADSMADIRGDFTHPADEEIEAAFVAQPEATELGHGEIPSLMEPEEPAFEPEPEPMPEPAPVAASPIEEPAPEPVVEAPAVAEEPEPTPVVPQTVIEEEPEPAAITPPPSFAETVKETPAMPEPAFTPPPSFAETAETGPAGMSTPQDDAWDFSTFAAETAAQGSMETPPLPPELPSEDLFGPATLADKPLGGQNSAKEAPPELPSSPAAAIGRMAGGRGDGQGNPAMKLIAVGAVVAVIIAAIFIVRGGDKAREGLQKLGSDMANNYQQEIPAEQQPENVQDLEQQMADELAAMDATDIPLAPPPALDEEMVSKAVGKKENNGTQIDFVDVAPDEENEPIVAEGNEDMPEEISAVAKLQQEIARLKAEREGTAEESETAATPLPEAPTKEQIDAELAAYRRALVEASHTDELPKPDEFMSGKTGVQETTTAGPEGLPPNTAYVENPYDLPVIPEPDADATSKVRTLNDFDLALFEPEEDRVRIPKGVRPRLSATDFPEVEVLSFVPERGIIATNRGRQGVLLLGESVEGWELVGVYDDYAEFRNGSRQYILTREQ